MRLSVDTFERMSLSEFYAAYDGFRYMREIDQRAAWERCRTAATISVAPWLKGTITPQELLPMPWDEIPAIEGDFDEISMDRRREIAEQMIEEYGKAGQLDDQGRRERRSSE